MKGHHCEWQHSVVDSNTERVGLRLCCLAMYVHDVIFVVHNIFDPLINSDWKSVQGGVELHNKVDVLYYWY